MIPFRTEKLIDNDIEYLPSSIKNFAEVAYGLETVVNDDESEKSYESLENLGEYGRFFFLYFNPIWSMIAAFATTYIYALLSYREFFDAGIINNLPLHMLFYTVSSIIDLIDCISLIAHYFCRECRSSEMFKRKSIVIIIINVLTIGATFMNFVIYFTKPGNGILTRMVLAIATLREYRLFEYFCNITKSPLRHLLIHVLIKYMLVLFVLNHTVACFWKYLACIDCDDGIEHWNKYVPKNISESELYYLCLYNALDSTTVMGLVGGSPRNNSEFLLTLILMIFSFLINTGVFLATFTDIQIDYNKRRALYQTKLSLIKEKLKVDQVSQDLSARINKWYVNLWLEEHGVLESSLLHTLPRCQKDNIKFDKYFNALNQNHYFRNLHLEVKMALANGMYTTYFNKDDTILLPEQSQKGMLYVAKGLVHMVTPDDAASPLITFEFGTSIGSTSILYSYQNQAHLVAATYCHIYNLDKDVCWRTLNYCYKLKPSGMIFNALKFIVKNARRNYEITGSGKNEETIQHFKLVKIALKQKGRTEVKGHLSHNTLIHVYQVKKELTLNQNMDAIFVRNKFPWILYQDSLFYKNWDNIVIICGIIVIVTYPYFLIYLGTPPSYYYQFLRPTVYLIYIIDIIIQIFTSVIDEQKQLISTVSEIIYIRCGKLIFFIDILSVIPFEIVSKFTAFNEDVLTECNHMFKIVRVFGKILEIICSLDFGGKVVRIIYYAICLSYFGYLQGIIYFGSGCLRRPCAEESWIKLHVKYLTRFGVTVDETGDYILLVSIYNGVMLLTGAGGMLWSYLPNEMVVITFFYITYFFFFTYLLADYSATLILDGYIKNQFITDINNFRNFMVVMEIKELTIARMNRFMETRYIEFNGKVIANCFEDLPLYLMDNLNVDKTTPFVINSPVFMYFPSDMFQLLLARVKYETYPPNEYIAYAGDRTYDILVIQKGYCELSQPRFELKGTLFPGSISGCIEMFLGLPLLFNVKSITNVKVFYLNVNDFNLILRYDLKMKKWVEAAIKKTRRKLKGMPFFGAFKEYLIKESTELSEKKATFMNFEGGKLDSITFDYNKGWGSHKNLSFLLLKRTILPDSSFLYGYVVFHAVVAFISSILYPALFILDCVIPWYSILLMSLPWDILCLLDVYLRFHVCYYNSQGLLVTHPKKTALYYLRHSFAVDFITALPLKLLLTPFGTRLGVAYFMFIKVIRAYRIPNGFALLHKDHLRKPNTFLLLLHYLSISLVLWHTFSIVLILLSCGIDETITGQVVLLPYKSSWFFTKLQSEITLQQNAYAQPLKVYLLALYATTCCSLQMTLGDIMPIHKIEIAYMIVIIIFGYIWFTYILVIIASNKGIFNDNLTHFKNDMKDLCKFMKDQKIPKSVRQRNIKHYTYIYQRNQGYKGPDIFSDFHPTLKRDCQLEMYQSTLKEVPVFEDVELNFLRELCSELNLVYYLENNNVICINDVVKWVYIVTRGYVQVFYPADARLRILKKGGMFGNLDNVVYSRSMVKVVTLTKADFLCLTTSDFYKLVAEYPILRQRLKFELANYNYTCLPQKANIDDFIPPKDAILHKFHSVLLSLWILYIYIAISYLSTQITLFHVVFPNYFKFACIFAYIIDGFHILKIYILFYTPFVNNNGEMVVLKKLIKKRYAKTRLFYIDVIGIIPFEVFAFAIPTTKISLYTMIAILRINRLIRFVNIPFHIKEAYTHLRANSIIIKVISIFTYSTCYLHLLSCIWYISACQDGICDTNSWIYDESKNSKCGIDYLCSLYYTTSLISTAGYKTFVPRKIVEVVLCILTIVVSKFVTTLLIANMAAVVRHFGYRLQNFSESVGVVKTHLKNSQISQYFQSITLKYIENLWLSKSGKQMPDFLEIGPIHLIMEVKVFAFGAHIFQNEILRDCHNDFLRLLTSSAKLVRYFNGDIICKQGEINDTMYFINSGQVHVLSITSKLEIEVDILGKFDSFGMIQGLFPKTPHSHTYESNGITDVITLNLNDWIQLLAFFPASKFKIYRIIREYNAINRLMASISPENPLHKKKERDPVTSM